MNSTSPRFMRAIPLILVLLTALASLAFAEDIKTLTKKAKGGDPKAQVTLGRAYSEGKGVPQNYAEAVMWYRKAADQGNMLAQHVLGNIYKEGKIVPQDYTEAAKWYRKAAERGGEEAMVNLGVMYTNGQGVPQDYVQSYFWFSLAASESSGEAFMRNSYSRDEAAKILTPDQLMKAQQMTREWEAKHPRK